MSNNHINVIKVLLNGLEFKLTTKALALIYLITSIN